MKIQDLLANLGGFFNAIYLISTVFFSDYIKFCYYGYIFEKINKEKAKSLGILNVKNNKIESNKNLNILKNNFVNQNENHYNQNRDHNQSKIQENEIKRLEVRMNIKIKEKERFNSMNNFDKISSD